ncbi:hypothetical protein [Sphingomonas xinjiangensis]|uniref:Lipoprotein n=1 Tax=Sphingomonas xinjiangensis TaxID=643568 RepID=A0A840YP12_9SPHN|nr:hypothetical protein [Sphingomonas xinjiangensis]MBB5712206.1 hypothetical protein [Sphingomonas xinjiangensis]
MRIQLAVAGALLLAACSKSPEDATATYKLGEQSAAMTLKVAANGDARIDMMGNTLIRKDGVDYLVGKDSQGTIVAKIDDLGQVIGTAMKESGVKPPAQPQQPDYELAKTGNETIANLPGDLWKLRAKGGAPAPGGELDAVIATDPAYKDMGKAMLLQTRMMTLGMRESGQPASKVDKAVEELMGKGLVLRLGRGVTLEKVEKAKFDADTFKLPGTALSKDALTARFKAERDKMQQAQKAAAQGGQVSAPSGAAPKAAAPAPVPPAK